MNIFLIHPDPLQSAIDFRALDPIRARKQLLECCQILASADILRFGVTTMRKKSGEPYNLTHQHHPITISTATNPRQWRLCCDVALGLAAAFPQHACAYSFNNWQGGIIEVAGCRGLIVVRSGHPHVFVNDYSEYAELLRPYLLKKIHP